MGVSDVRWGANKVDFTYNCSGCGHELDKTIAEDTPRVADVAALDAKDAAVPAASAPVGVTPPALPKAPVEDLGTFPFRTTTPTPSERITLKPKLESEEARVSTYVPRQTFIEDRATRTPRQVFEEDRSPPPQDLPTQTTRASVLLRDFAIFNL
jgi:hypothetical protein